MRRFTPTAQRKGELDAALSQIVSSAERAARERARASGALEIIQRNERIRMRKKHRKKVAPSPVRPPRELGYYKAVRQPQQIKKLLPRRRGG